MRKPVSSGNVMSEIVRQSSTKTQYPERKPAEKASAIAENVYARVHGERIVDTFVRVGSVAGVARRFRVRCATVEAALLDRLNRRSA